MQTLTSLRHSERIIATVRWVAVVFAAVQVTVYAPSLPSLANEAAAVRLPAYVLVVLLAGIALAVEVALRVLDSAAALARFGLAVLVLDVLVGVGFVFVYAFDPLSGQWTLLTLLPLEGALRFQLVGALGVWSALAPAYVLRELYAGAAGSGSMALSAVVFRVGVLLVIAAFAGVVTRDLHRQRRQLQQLSTSAQRVVAPVEEAEILRALCREACSCVRAEAAVVYAYDGECFRPVASWPAQALVAVLEQEDDIDAMPFAAEGLLERPRWLHAGRDRPSQLSVPLQRREDPERKLLVIRARHGRPSGLEVEVAQSLAESAALALATTRILTGEQRRNRRLRYLEALRTRFVATVAHDLRLPLTVLKGAAQMLRGKHEALSSAQVQSLLGDVERQANRLSRLADDLLDAARLDEDKLVLRPGRCDLRDVIMAVVADVGEDDVQVKIEGDVTAIADASRVERSLWNLLSNAEKYGRPPLEVRAWRHDAHVCVSVRDHGPGLDAAQRTRLFAPYSPGDDPTSVGLGLAIVAQLVAAHGGTVGYEDAGPGARFTLRLPVAGPSPDGRDGGTQGDVIALPDARSTGR